MILNFLQNITLLNNVLLLTFYIIFAIMFYRANNNKGHPLNWADMLLDPDTRKLSLTRMGNFIGISTSTWVIIYFVQVKEAYGMFPSLFIAWLGFLIGAHSFNNFINKVPGVIAVVFQGSGVVVLFIERDNEF